MKSTTVYMTDTNLWLLSRGDFLGNTLYFLSPALYPGVRVNGYRQIKFRGVTLQRGMGVGE